MPHTKYIFSSQAIFGFSMLLVIIRSSWVHLRFWSGLVWASSFSRSLLCIMSAESVCEVCEVEVVSPLFHWIVCCQDLSSPDVDGEDEISS